MRLDPHKDLFKMSLIAASGLNTQEFIRVVKKLRMNGKEYDEKYDKKIDTVIVEDRSRYRVHVIYVWEESPDDDFDKLYIKYVKKIK